MPGGNGNNSCAMPPETLIAVEHLSRYYGAHCAVSDLSFTVLRGEILGFLGPNGAGKTTTMQMLCGVLAPSSGRVSIAGHDLAEDPRAAKSHIGYLPEHPPLYGDLTVDQYLNYCAQLRRVPSAERAAAVRRSKQRCGLEETGARLIGNLSKGFHQRIGIAQAIIHSPAVVILDEPTVGLDPNQIVEIRGLIRELGDVYSVILSTHILTEAQAVCDRALIIDEGKLVLDEPLSELRESDQAQVFTVALRRPPPLATLQAVDGVAEVQALDAQHFRIAGRAGSDAAVALSECAAAQGWGLYELVPAAGTLEEIYLQLTRGEMPAPGAQA